MGDQQLSQPETSEGEGLLFFQHHQGQCGPLSGMDGSLSHALGLESVQESNSPASPCFDPDPMDANRLEMGRHKGMELTGNAGWGHSDMGSQVNVKQEPSDSRLARAASGYTYNLPYEQCEDQLPKRTDGKLDSFNEAFANRHSLVHSSGVMGSYAQNATLRQMLSEKPPTHHYPHPRVPQHMPCMPTTQQPKVMLPQSLHYSYSQLQCLTGLQQQQQQQQLPAITQQMVQDFLQQPAAPMQQQQLHKASGEVKQQSDSQHQMVHYHQMQQPTHHHLLQHMQVAQISRDPTQRTVVQCQPGTFKQFHHSINVAPQYLYSERHYRVQGQQRDSLTHQLYQQPNHSSAVQSPQQFNTSTSVQYTAGCSQQELENGEDSACAELQSPLSAVVAKDVGSQACPQGIFWQQVHQVPQAYARVSDQRRGMEEKPDVTYSFTCGYCKEQFRSLSALHIHTGTNGCMRTLHSVAQNDGEKLPGDGGHLSPPFTAASMSVKMPVTERCRQDTLLEENPGCFLAEQDMPTFTRKADFSAEESSEPPVPKNLPVTVYQSYLRLANIITGEQQSSASTPSEPPHYTPPPMLNPNRKSSGLFSNLSGIDPSTNSTPSPFSCNQLNGFQFVHQANTATVNNVIPCINIGPRFQAVIPDLMDTLPGEEDVHAADLVWRPWKELVENDEVQQKVEDLLNMACSSVLPGGGLNREFTLHCLYEVDGDIMAALEMLLLNNGARSTSHPLADYHYTGSSNWTPSERRVFNKAFGMHRKDFHMVQKMVRSKLVTECVEYYYNFKKILKFNKKHRPRPSDTDEDWNNVFRQDTDCEPFPSSQSIQPAHRGEQESLCPTVIGNFPCKQCGKMFYKIKSRNAHMKIHRQQDDWQHRSQDSLYPPVTYTGAALAKSTNTPPAYPSWDNREIQEQLEAMSEAMTCTSLPPLYHQDVKLNLAKEKCQIFSYNTLREMDQDNSL
ncbi:transcriptional-regulating factor 1-like isoform X2 [Heterodontus francisci]|uniref:transcriptional-regulating factor 1-like isoform X2 n=1 Tax=Heterodontus francisci TaxID=7792 RepID=UPI00355BC164